MVHLNLPGFRARRRRGASGRAGLHTRCRGSTLTASSAMSSRGSPGCAATAASSTASSSASGSAPARAGEQPREPVLAERRGARAGLRDAVRVQDHGVPGPEHGLRVGQLRVGDDAEHGPELRELLHPPVGAQDHRRRMPAEGEPDAQRAVRAGRDVGERDGDELRHGGLGPHGRVEPLQRPARRPGLQRGGAQGVAGERGDGGAGGALARHVAHEQRPLPVARAGRRRRSRRRPR